MGLLREQAGRSNSWPALRKALHLVVDEMPEHEIGAEPSDMAYVYSGYAPLSVRGLTLTPILTLTLTLTLGDAAETVAKSLLVQWRELTGKDLFPSPALEDITKFVQTVKKGAAVMVHRPLCAPVLP